MNPGSTGGDRPDFRHCRADMACSASAAGLKRPPAGEQGHHNQMRRRIMALMLTTTDISTLVGRMTLRGALDLLSRYIQEDFIRWESFEKTARLASHSRVGVIELMPTADADRYSFKFVNGHPLNPSQGLPTVMAFGAL